MILSHVPFSLKDIKGNLLTFTSGAVNEIVRVFVLEDDIIRVLMSQNGELALGKTWAVAPGMEDIPKEGRDKLDITPFSRPPFSHLEKDGVFTVETSKVRMEITLDGFKVCWYEKSPDGEWTCVLRDRQTQAYNFGHSLGEGPFHYTESFKDELVYGLGEKAGNLERTGRSFTMKGPDPMGYDAETTDPLYKHWPFYITYNSNTGLSYGLFYDNFSIAWFDMGKEIDCYHGSFRSYHGECGDLDYYFMAGPHISDVTMRFSWLTGKTAFMPKWSLGYSGSTMTYTEADNAQEQLMKFIEECDENGIPCDSFQLSSGYTTINGKRYVFNWNYDKFPDPKKFAADFHARGVKLCANIKPALLLDHPKYEELDKKGLYLRSRDGSVSELSQFWGGVGSYIDFTNTQAYDWWKDQVTKQLLEYGIDSTWNDNNEYEVWDGQAKANGFGHEVNVGLIRPVLTLLMMKASFDAQTEFAPEKRPYLISRSGSPGMQRYVQTWSGDNRTSWKTLKYNIKMGVGMSLSGMYNIGHDIGGFAGDAPEPELFVRWVQNGTFTPRFTIHSWNDDKTVNVPWMYPEYTALVRKTMLLRVRLTPYFYDLLYRSHENGEPFLRPVFYNYENDAKTFAESDDFMVGRDLLVASVVNKGQFERSVYLPEEEYGWTDFHTGLWYDGGQTVTLPAPIQYNPLLVRGGAIIPVNDAEIDFKRKADDKRGFLLFAPRKGKGFSSYELFEDDGETQSYRDGNFAKISISMDWDEKNVRVGISKTGKYELPYKTVALHLQDGDNRTVSVNGKLCSREELSAVLL